MGFLGGLLLGAMLGGFIMLVVLACLWERRHDAAIDYARYRERVRP
jgi:hypothetical protein